jgi:hypothetical protein
MLAYARKPDLFAPVEAPQELIDRRARSADRTSRPAEARPRSTNAQAAQKKLDEQRQSLDTLERFLVDVISQGLGGAHATRAPQVRMGATTVNGRLPPEVIQRIVRQNYGRFRLCYENGLRNNPNLQGRVSVRFVIGRDGAVSNVSNGGSDLPDSSVVQCVVRAYYGLTFPQPEGGIVTVVYPIMFSPGD